MRNKLQDESQPLGLDEIMIVNPGSMPIRLYAITALNNHQEASPHLFLGDDGVIYALHGREEPVRPGDFILRSSGECYRADMMNLGDDLADWETE